MAARNLLPHPFTYLLASMNTIEIPLPPEERTAQTKKLDVHRFSLARGDLGRSKVNRLRIQIHVPRKLGRKKRCWLCDTAYLDCGQVCTTSPVVPVPSNLTRHT